VNEACPGVDPAKAETNLVAACALSCVPGIGAATLARIATLFGSLEQALEAGSLVLFSRAADLRLGAKTRCFLEQDPDLERLGRWALSAARAAGAKVLLRSDASYPRLLGTLANAPAVLYVRGELVPDAHRVAVVGARAADEASLRLARGFGEQLAAAGVEIVS
jgi:DNA processing protein